jgi:hypothetical protein
MRIEILLLVIIFIGILYFGIREILKDKQLSVKAKSTWLIFTIPFNVLTIICYLVWRLFRADDKNGVVIVLGVVIMLSASCNSTPEKVQLSKLEFYPKNIDFGKMQRDSIYKNHFYIKNVGDIPLRIINVVTSCGCTVAKSNTKLVNVNDSTKVEFTFDTHSRGGEQDRNISVFANTVDTIHFFNFKGSVEIDPRLQAK